MELGMGIVGTLKMCSVGQRERGGRQCSPRRPPPLVPGRSMSSGNNRARQCSDREQWGIGRQHGGGLEIKAGAVCGRRRCELRTPVEGLARNGRPRHRYFSLHSTN